VDWQREKGEWKMSRKRRLLLESLEGRHVAASDGGSLSGASWHNVIWPSDVDANDRLTPRDALLVINELNRRSKGNGESGGSSGGGTNLGTPPANNRFFLDVVPDENLTPQDALSVINELNTSESGLTPPIVPSSGAAGFNAAPNAAEQLGSQNLLLASEVQTLLERASRMSPSNDAIIAIVDRTGQILGVRVEAGVDPSLRIDPTRLAFAIDGAVAKARTAAFFSSNEAPLTSRTVRFISQSTVTQREVESSPLHDDPRYRGPGFVAPIGVGGHFPPQVRNTPQVDLFGIEHQSRDSKLHAGIDNRKGTTDDITLNHRFNADPTFIPSGGLEFMQLWPESYGFQAGTAVESQSRGIGTLPGGVPLYKRVTQRDGSPSTTTPGINLVGGIGVFFPGPDGYATYEQGFVHANFRGGVPQSEYERNNADRALEAEFIALATAANGTMVGRSAFVRDLSEFERGAPRLTNFVLPTGRIDLVGITLEIYGPTPNREFKMPGIDRLIDVGRRIGGGSGASSGSNVPVLSDGTRFQAGKSVPEGWLVAPHASKVDNISAADVQRTIEQGVAEANKVRAAIRLDPQGKPGARTKMVLAVTDTQGEILGLFRMPDATVFSIDVAVAKARNTSYYADREDLQFVDRIDFDDDGVLGPVSSDPTVYGDTVPAGTALSNRTFRFIVEPRYPTGTELPDDAGVGLVNDPARDLASQRPDVAAKVGPQSILRLPGIQPKTAENLVPDDPLPDRVYASPSTPSVLAFTAFNPSRNFRDPGDEVAVIPGTELLAGVGNQNGVVFFPGSTPLYTATTRQLIGGFGVSGDGVDQDDVVTAAGQVGLDAPASIRSDAFVVAGVRLPFQKYNRNPRGP
jgi:uncharacterized protein GlcG (DUF336 family)